MDPRIGKDGIKEYERAVAADAGFMGFGIIGQTAGGIPASDPIWDPFYKVSIDAGIPVLIHCGLTGIGQGMPGGGGIILDDGHPPTYRCRRRAVSPSSRYLPPAPLSRGRTR